jgi:hypothetical protein
MNLEHLNLMNLYSRQGVYRLNISHLRQRSCVDENKQFEYIRSTCHHMSVSSFTKSSSFKARSPFSFSSRFRCRLLTVRPGVNGVTGVKGMYALYGVGTPVIGPVRFLVGRSKIVVLVAGALCRG